MSQNKSMVYYESCETEFKIRYSNHKQSFKFENKKHATELSKAVWNAKDAGETPLIEWSIVKCVPPLSMWLQDMPALPSRKNVHLTSRQEKLAEQKIKTSAQMPPYKQISIKERSIKSVVLFCR